MPRRVTMHLRNKLAFLVMVFAVAVPLISQTPATPQQPQTTPQQQPQSTPPQGNPQQTPAQPGQPAGQGTQQGRPLEEQNGTFIIRTQVQEVQLHATVVDDKGHLVQNLDRNA